MGNLQKRIERLEQTAPNPREGIEQTPDAELLALVPPEVLRELEKASYEDLHAYISALAAEDESIAAVHLAEISPEGHIIFERARTMLFGANLPSESEEQGAV